MAERRIRGVAASPGLVVGRLLRLDSARTPGGTGALGPEHLRAAIAEAQASLADLAAGLEAGEAEIILTHIAFLEDEELARPAFEAIAAGAPADAAWRDALDAEIAAYEAAEDAYFRARAADFADVRDRVLAALHGQAVDRLEIATGTIVLADDLRPSQLLAARWEASSAIALAAGSPNSHAAMLARGRGIAMVVGLGDAVLSAEGEALLDGFAGELILQPASRRREAAHRWQQRQAEDAQQAEDLAALPARTRDGTLIGVEFTLAGPDEIEGLDPARCDGIGLVRTELFLDRLALLQDEERQYAAYSRILSWANGRPVTFRTVDAGGDKPISGYTLEAEANPFLGMRGIRLSLARPEIFRVQLRALARAAARGNLRIMLPMVTSPGELDAAREMLASEIEALARNGIAHALPPLGIMVEVPSVALMPERFAADFYSIGSNDLSQYLFAADRGNTACAHLAPMNDPALLQLLANVASHGRATGRSVSLCGDAGGDPEMVPHLLKAGLRSLSVQPGLASRVKTAIARVHLEGSCADG